MKVGRNTLQWLRYQYQNFVCFHKNGENKMIICVKHVLGWQWKLHKVKVFLSTKRWLAQKFGKRKTKWKWHVNKSVFSQFKFLESAPCIFWRFFRTSTLHFWLSSVCFDAFKRAIYFTTFSELNKQNRLAPCIHIYTQW